VKNVTVTLDEKVARWARVWAAKHNTSVSKMLGEFLAERMSAENGYDRAMRAFLSRKPQRLRSNSAKLPKRDSLYDR
jgi:hypothetical protein